MPLAAEDRLRLDYYADGARYDAENVHIRSDVDYYARVAQRLKQGSILELACGTGRLTFPMAKTGAQVVGVDNAPGMLQEANLKRSGEYSDLKERVEFELGDMRELRLDRTFDAVVVGFNSLMHMVSDEDFVQALATAREHLDPRGYFYFDVNLPTVVPVKRDPKQRFDPQQMIEQGSGHRYVVSENNDYDARHQINTMHFFYQRVDHDDQAVGPERHAQIKVRVMYPKELNLWLRLAGFEVMEDWDDFACRQPFTGCGGRRVVLARRV